MLVPTQASRRAAARPGLISHCRALGYTRVLRAKILRGEKDHDELVQAFEAFRRATIDECVKAVKASGDVGCSETRRYAAWFEAEVLALKGE